MADADLAYLVEVCLSGFPTFSIPSPFPLHPDAKGITHRPCLRSGRQPVLLLIKFGSPIHGTQHMSSAPQLLEASVYHSR